MITIETWRGQEITGTLKSESWNTIVVTPLEPDFAEYHIPKNMIRLWNGEEY